MILKMKVQQVGLMLTCIPLLLLSSLVMADQDQHMLIDIDSDRVEIDQLDISHLTPGDSEMQAIGSWAELPRLRYLG